MDFEKQYKEFLQKEIDYYCNANKEYEIYWDYGDSLDAETLKEAVQNYKSEGYDDVKSYLENGILDNNFDYDEGFFDNILNDLRTSDYSKEFKEYVENQDYIDDLYELGYNGIDPKVDDLLKNAEYYINICFATESEKNSDMSALVNTFGSTCRVPEKDKQNYDNALTYLVHQQGHKLTEYMEMRDRFPFGFTSSHQSTFVDSLVDENMNNTSEAMSELVALVRLDGNEAVDFFNKLNDSNQNLKFSKSTTFGVLNEWVGCCGLLDIKLEKDVIIPANMVSNIQIEGTKEDYRYTVDEICGLTGECWQKNAVTFTDEQPQLVEEDYDEVVDLLVQLDNEREVEIM